MTPPAPEECLVQARSGKYKGGTLVAEEVLDLVVHEVRRGRGSARQRSRTSRAGVEHDRMAPP